MRNIEEIMTNVGLHIENNNAKYQDARIPCGKGSTKVWITQ